MNHIDQYFKDAVTVLNQIDKDQIEKMIQILLSVRMQQGRLFLLGVGGSAGNCIHAVNDFRKLAGIESYSPAENIAEITARTNDDGWETVFSEWLKCSRLNEKDAVLVFSVGGGSKEKNISANIVYALDFAKEKKARIMGVVSRDGGYTAKLADACVVVPPVNPNTITPHAEAFQGVIWHLIVSDPRIMQIDNKWESVTNINSKLSNFKTPNI
jgi:D-sedoheptulose 7-phosphate isomerase